MSVTIATLGVVIEEAQYQAAASLAPDRAFTITTGDIVEGATWLITNSEILFYIAMYNRLRASIGQVFPTMGDHDANPVNSSPPDGVSINYSNQYEYNNHAQESEKWIGPQAAAQVAQNYGMYSTHLPPLGLNTTLRITSINTMFWKGVIRDPSSVLTLLATTLQDAEDKGERAYIFGHIPPGRPDCLYDYSSYPDQIVQRKHRMAGWYGV